MITEKALALLHGCGLQPRHIHLFEKCASESRVLPILPVNCVTNLPGLYQASGLTPGWRRCRLWHASEVQLLLCHGAIHYLWRPGTSEPEVRWAVRASHYLPATPHHVKRWLQVQSLTRVLASRRCLHLTLVVPIICKFRDPHFRLGTGPRRTSKRGRAVSPPALSGRTFADTLHLLRQNFAYVAPAWSGKCARRSVGLSCPTAGGC